MVRIAGPDAERSYPGQQLPDEIIFSILSYLPLSSLFSFKLVCKRWNTLFLHPHLAYLHDRYCSYLDDVEEETKISGYLIYGIIGNSSQGLLLEQKAHCIKANYSMYRIRCPILRQKLDIPSPQNPSLCIALEFVQLPNLGAVKLVSVHEDDENQYSLGYEILSLGIGSDRTTYCWRTVTVPPSNLLNSERDCRMRKRMKVFFRLGVAYCIWYVETGDGDLDIEVDVLDMVSESYIGHTTFPRGGFFSKLSNTNPFDWNGRLSFAELVKDELHVLVFDDYKKLKWAERKRIIKLTFLKPDHKEQITFSTFGDNSMLFFVRQDQISFCIYDINTGELETTILDSIASLKERYFEAPSFDFIAEMAALIMFHRANP